MNRVNDFLNGIPSWLITIIAATLTTFITIKVAIAELETKTALQDARIERLEANKIGKEVADEWNKRFDRIENKIDRLVETKDNEK